MRRRAPPLLLTILQATVCFSDGWSGQFRTHSRKGLRCQHRRYRGDNGSIFCSGGVDEHDVGCTGNSIPALPTGWITEGNVQKFGGAGIPRSDLLLEDIPTLLMTALELNDDPYINAGVESMWNFSGDTTRFIFQHNMTDFIESVFETADEFPTSLYGAAIYGQSWEMESKINRVGGEDGWIATQVMKTISSDGRMRRWQWELRKNRRPPCLGCWKVESIGSSDRKGNFESEK